MPEVIYRNVGLPCRECGFPTSRRVDNKPICVMCHLKQQKLELEKLNKEIKK